MSDRFETKTKFSELADKVIGMTLKAGAEGCRIGISRRRFVEINYREQRAEVIKEATTQGLQLEVYFHNRYAVQSTPDLRLSTLGGFVENTIASAGMMEEDPFRSLPDPMYYGAPYQGDLQLSDPDYQALTAEERHHMAATIEKACLQHGGGRVIMVEAGEYDESWEDYTKTSNGFEEYLPGTIYQAGASMTAKDEGDRRPAGHHWVSCRHRSDLPSLTETGIQAAIRTLDLTGGRKIATETLPVIIENRVAAGILNGLVSALSGSSIQQKRSFLADKMGSLIGSPVFTLTDDPLIIRGLGSMPTDADGFAACPRELISAGRVNEFLINWYYSRKLECEPTTGSLSNLIIPPGKRDLSAIISDLGRCLLITGFIGGNSNPTTGDFSKGFVGKLYDHGRFVHNIAEMNLADNHLHFWNKLVETANDPYMYSSARLPSLVFDGVVVSGV